MKISSKHVMFVRWANGLQIHLKQFESKQIRMLSEDGEVWAKVTRKEVAVKFVARPELGWTPVDDLTVVEEPNGQEGR